MLIKFRYEKMLLNVRFKSYGYFLNSQRRDEHDLLDLDSDMIDSGSQIIGKVDR